MARTSFPPIAAPAPAPRPAAAECAAVLTSASFCALRFAFLGSSCKPTELVALETEGGGAGADLFEELKTFPRGLYDFFIGDGAGGRLREAIIFSTWFEGNRPSRPCTRPTHQSSFFSSTISITSPAANDRSFWSFPFSLYAHNARASPTALLERADMSGADDTAPPGFIHAGDPYPAYVVVGAACSFGSWARNESA